MIASDAEELSFNVAGFVEVVLTKAGDQELSLIGIVLFGGDVHVELWDEAVKMLPLLCSSSVRCHVCFVAFRVSEWAGRV